MDNSKLIGVEQYPLIDYYFIPEEPPLNIVPYNKIKSCKSPMSTYVCFFCRDEDFAKVIKNPKRYVAQLSKFAGIIGLDISVYNDMPIIQQKFNMFMNLAITHYYATQGIKVIPNFRFGLDTTFEDFALAIPKNCLVAIGTYGCIKTIHEKNLWIDVIIRIIEHQNPRGIVIYGSAPKEMKNLINLYGINYYIFDPVIKNELKILKKKKKSNE